MSNNRGNITLARQIALRDIAKYMEERLKKQTKNKKKLSRNSHLTKVK